MSQQAHFTRFITPHLTRLYRLAYRLTATRSDAEDLIQDLLIKIYPRTDELLSLDNPAAWLARVLYHLHIDSHRQQTRSAVHLAVDNSVSDSALNSLPDTAQQTAQSSHQALELDWLQAAIDQLSEEHRTLLLMHDVEGYTLNELTDILDVPLVTLKSRLHRARARLRDLLAD